MLIESRFDRGGQGWAVMGVGLNLAISADEFPAEVGETATSLALASGSAGPRPDEARAELDRALEHWVDEPPGRVLEEFRRRDGLAGREISWDGGAGTASGIDESGHLLVELGDGTSRALGAGEVHLSLEG